MSRAKLGIILFVISETTFFGLLVTSYIYFHGDPGGGPTAANSLNALRTGLFSILLFSSSGTMVMAARSYRKGRLKGALGWLCITIVLGGGFLVGQALEYADLFAKGVVINRNLFATTFFTLTGFHGLHVLIGLIALAILTGLLAGGKVGAGARDSDAFEAVGIYWHFVDAVWVLIFSVVYLWAVL